MRDNDYMLLAFSASFLFLGMVIGSLVSEILSLETQLNNRPVVFIKQTTKEGVTE